MLVFRSVANCGLMFDAQRELCRLADGKMQPLYACVAQGTRRVFMHHACPERSGWQPPAAARLGMEMVGCRMCLPKHMMVKRTQDLIGRG